MDHDITQGHVVRFGGRTDVLALHAPATWVFHDPGVRSAASWRRIGAACTGTNGPPLITAGVPFLGNPGFVLDLQSARPSSLCVIAVATATQNLALGGGCSLYVAGSVIAFPLASSAGGFATTRLRIPADASLVGHSVFAQGLVVDPLGAHAGLAITSGLQITFGW
jgi:hypothetical protein